MGNDEKYLYKNLFDTYIKQKAKNGISKTYIAKISKQHQNYILPNFGNKDIKTIKYIDLFIILNAIFNPNNPRTSRLEIIHRLITILIRSLIEPSVMSILHIIQQSNYIVHFPPQVVLHLINL